VHIFEEVINHKGTEGTEEEGRGKKVSNIGVV